MASDEDDFLDLDFAVDLQDEDPEATRLAPMLEPSASIFIFEPEGDQATEALKRAGIKVQRATMGSEMMSAAQKRSLQAVLISPTTDAELRELFLRAFRGKFERVPVLVLSQKHDDPKEQAQYRYEGATAAISWPLPPAAELVQLLQTYTQAPVEVVPGQGSLLADEDRSAELRVLSRKVSALERHRDGGAAPGLSEEDLERARRAAEEREREATSLRSELTLVRERSAMLQDRIDRLINDLAAVTRERDEFKLKSDKLEESTAAGQPSDETLQSLRKIGQSADSFVWGLEQAIQFFEDLSFEAGDKRAPSLKGHIRSLKLVRALLERIRDRLHQL